MSAIGSVTTRTTSLMQSDQLLATLQRVQHDMAVAQQQISSGQAVTKPSDAPQSVTAILYLRDRLAARTQHDQNLQFAQSTLDNTDQALGDASNTLLEAKSIASSQIGVGSSTDTRANQATVIDAQIQSLLETANRRFQSVALFGGSYTPGLSGSTADNAPVFTEFLGGIRYTGARTNLATDIGLDRLLELNSNGQDAFGGLSSRVQSTIDLNPHATAATRLSDLTGAQNQGVRQGSIVVTVDGTATTVDLTGADTLADVVTRVNAAIGGVDPTAGSLSVTGTTGGFTLTAAGGHAITLGETGAGQTAGDLGLRLSVTGGSVTGGDLNPRLTLLTPLAALGANVDWASGLKITQGNQTKVADFSQCQTVQDLVNGIDQLGLGLRMEINSAGNSLNLVSEVSGVEMSVGENNGGTTAGDLGLRTFGADTQLADLNHGLGVSHTAGQDDFAIQTHGGATFNVSIDGAASVADVIARIRAAATSAGLNVGAPGAAGTDFNVGLAQDGNGLTLEDHTAGGAAFQVTQLNTSLAATDLGIYANAQAGNTIAGSDVATVRAESVFTHLMSLRDALAKDDSRGITLAGSAIEKDLESLARVRADVGVRSQRAQQQTQRSQELQIAEKTALSGLQDADMTQVITRFTQLQTQLEASLKMGAQNLQLSLLDYLR